MKHYKLSIYLLFLPICLSAKPKIPENVLILGVCKNIATQLPNSMKIVEDIGALFDDYSVLVYEDNSTDDTPFLLRKWARTNPKVEVICEVLREESFGTTCVNKTAQNTFYRPEKIARARNIILERALTHDYDAFPYIIWIDLDVEKPFTYEGIIETFRRDDWDAVFAYGVEESGKYFDWYAHRDATYPFGPEVHGEHFWFIPKTLHLKKKADWYPVFSAFNGLGIYRKSSLKDCKYSSISTPDFEKWVQSILNDPNFQSHPQIIRYKELAAQATDPIYIPTPHKDLPYYPYDTPMIISQNVDSVIWRVSSGIHQYPATCEHSPLHASMIVKGHGRLFINPRIRTHYNNRR